MIHHRRGTERTQRLNSPCILCVLLRLRWRVPSTLHFIANHYNAFSQRPENHVHAIALHYMHYNFCRIHQTLRCTPAMEAGITKTPWGIKDIVALPDNPTYAS